jgi:hypothetical protein
MIFHEATAELKLLTQHVHTQQELDTVIQHIRNIGYVSSHLQRALSPKCASRKDIVPSQVEELLAKDPTPVRGKGRPKSSRLTSSVLEGGRRSKPKRAIGAAMKRTQSMADIKDENTTHDHKIRVRRTYTCRECGEQGHDRRTCAQIHRQQSALIQEK